MTLIDNFFVPLIDRNVFTFEAILIPEHKRIQLGNRVAGLLAILRSREEKSPLSEADWRTTRNAVVRDSLLPVAAGLSVLYIVIAVSHALVLPKPAAAPMSLVALVTGTAFMALRAALRRWQMPAPWAHPVAAALAGLVLVNCFLHLYFVPEPQQTTNLLLLIVGAGFLFLSTRWLAVAILTTLAGWALLVWRAPPSPNWMHFGFALYMATILSVMVHTVRVRTLKYLEILRQQDERRQSELETALRAAETARGVAEAMKQDLMQSEARLRLVTNQMPAVLWTTDSELRITSSLGMGLSVLDLQPHEMLEMMRFKYSSPPAPEFLPIVAHRRALEGESVRYEIDWKGHTFGCQVEPLYDAEKKLIGTIGIAFNITARQLAEETPGWN